MAATDILNPDQAAIDPRYSDVLTPDYGFIKRRPLTTSSVRAADGPPWTRETSAGGHVFTLNWLNRSPALIERLKWFQEQFEDGFFTIIDWEDIDPNGIGRHHVGRFVSEVQATPVAHGKHSATQVQFEELPGCPMVNYPCNWDADAVDKYVLDDFGQVKVNSLQGDTGLAWAVAQHTPDPNNPPITTLDGTSAANTWAQYEYRGYGFRLYLMSSINGPSGIGGLQVYLDGELLGVTTGALQSVNPEVFLAYEMLNVPLGIHRVKLVAPGVGNINNVGRIVSWYKLQVMR